MAVLHPWTPVEAKHNADGWCVSVWNREYRFGSSILPQQIVSGGTELLASPVRAEGVEYGQPIVWHTASLWPLEQREEEVTLVGQMESRLAVLNAVIRIEFDGYVHYSLRLSPRGNHIRAGIDAAIDPAPRDITQLHLIFPFKSTESTERFRTRPNETVVRGETRDERFAFMPLSWYGNEKRGLSFYLESDENWQSASDAAVMQFTKKSNANELQWNLLDSLPLEWKKERMLFREKDNEQGLSHTPVFFEFSMQATPVKPFTDIAFKEHTVHIDCFHKLDAEYYEYLMGPVSKENPTIVMDYLKEKGVNCLRLHEKWCEIEGYWRTGPQRTEEIRQIVKEAHARGIKVLLYFTMHYSTLRPESLEVLKANRVLTPLGVPRLTHYRQPPQRCFRACAKGPAVFDTFIDGMAEAMERFGADGVYLDTVNHPEPCTNAAHGCGYDTPEGRKPTWAVEEQHSSWRRLYAKLHEEMGKEIHIHPWTSFSPAMMAYGDVIWNGEQLMFNDIIPNSGEVHLDMHFFHSEGMGVNTGIPVEFLIYELPDDRWTFEKGLSFCGPHGVWPRPNSIYRPLEVMSGIWRILDDFDAANSTFLPYWEHGTGAVSENTKVLVSAYAKGNKRLYLVSNPTGTVQKTVLSLESGMWTSNARTGEKMEGRTAIQDIPPYTLLLLEALF